MINLFDSDNSSGATFSQCRKYRYALWRVWDRSKPLIMFIGLNPSTASEEMDDPTIRRVKRFAKDWGYGGVYMCNLFAIVSTNPDILLESIDLQGANNEWLDLISVQCKDILFAWGNFKQAETRSKEIMQKFPQAICLGINKNGSPKHPLYVAAKTSQINFQ